MNQLASHIYKPASCKLAIIAAVIVIALTCSSMGIYLEQPAQAHAASTTVATQAKTYDIVFKLNGGTQASGQITTIAKGKTIKASKLKAPKRARYKFVGWYANRALTQKATALKGTADAANRTVYAKWKLKSYNILYSLNGGTFPGKYTKTIGKNKTIKASTLAQPTRKGYTFAGWYADKDLKTKATTLKGVANSARRTLYAKWKPLGYVISYELNGGAFSKAYPIEYETSTGLASLPTPERSGHSFIGWYADSTLTQHVTSIPSGTSGNKLFNAKWRERIMIAHRGYCAGGAAANSLDAFKAAAEKGFKYIDAEVRFAADGKAMIGSAALSDLLNICEEYGMVTYLEPIEGSDSQIDNLVSEVDKRGMTDVVRWASTSGSLLERVQHIHPRASLVLLAQSASDDVMKTAETLAKRGADVMVGVDSAHAKEAVAPCRAIGMPLGIWTLADASKVASYEQYVSAFAVVA